MVHLTYTRADGEVEVTLPLHIPPSYSCHHVKDVNVTVIRARAFFNQNIVLVEVICHDKVKNIAQLHSFHRSALALALATFTFTWENRVQIALQLERYMHAISR